MVQGEGRLNGVPGFKGSSVSPAGARVNTQYCGTTYTCNTAATPLLKAPLAGSVLHESALPLFLWRRSTMANSFIGVIRLLLVDTFRLCAASRT
eukprot:scaffold85989_cov64-Phaeocystis_antarctica.AAC.6